MVGAGPAGLTVAGDLILKGNGNQVANLFVVGKVVLKGNNNELENIEYEAEEGAGE